jgi:two-component sensor histidine kinase
MQIMTNRSSQLLIPPGHVLLNELNHRISNEFTSAISIISRVAARSSDMEVKATLTHVTELLHRYAEVHQALQMPKHDVRMDSVAYLRNLCLSISRSKLDRMNITLVLATPPLWLQSDQCWLLGMLLHELITNAARHAFARNGGTIRVELLRTRSFVECRVLDNGSAPENFRPGRGLKIVNELTKALNGRFDQKFETHGSASIVVFPTNCEPPITANGRSEYERSPASDDMILVPDLDQSLPTPQTATIE